MEKQPGETKAPMLRQIIIETDGTNVTIKRAEVASPIEFKGILTMLLDYINTPKKAPSKVPETTPAPEPAQTTEEKKAE